MFGFFMGVLIFRLWAQGWSPPRLPYPLIALALAVCLFRWFPQWGGFAARIIFKVVVMLPALVALASQAQVSGAWLGSARYLGVISYPFYAIHVPLLRGFEVLLGRLFDTPPHSASWLALGATLVFAALFERLHDAPIRFCLARRRQTK